MNDRRSHLWRLMGAGFAAAALWLAGCSTPIGVEQVPTRKAYGQVGENVLSTGQPSAATTVILDRYQFNKLAAKSPDEAVRELHAKAVATGERDLLFALAELSFMAGDHFSRSGTAPGGRDPRDYYLGAAVYAWLFLFGEGSEPPPSAFDRRFREACDFYNYGLGLAFTENGNEAGVVRFATAWRRLPVGEIELQVDGARVGESLATFEQILLADRYRVRGLSVRNREPGIGTPLICVKPVNPEFGSRSAVPMTALLRCPMTLAALGTKEAACALELYPSFDYMKVDIGLARVPLEVDLTTYLAYTLNQSKLWKLGPMQFREPAKNVRSQLILSQPYEPDRIPVVFVHGTFSSPLTWAEMSNTLTADPVLRRRYQVWQFVYGSGNPLVYSMADLREVLTAKIQQLDPAGTNPLLHQMVVIGHSQGGLLAKSIAIDTGDALWKGFSSKTLDDPSITAEQRAEFQRVLFLKPLPFVRRVVFIATPHRGGYHNKGLVRSLGQRLVSLPGDIVAYSSDLVELTKGTEAEDFLNGRMPTSVDGMSPDNPALRVMADIPVAPWITAHSIIAVEKSDDPAKRRDGLVTYESAHLDYAQSEFVVDSFHTCLNHPATIEEVRRILHLHLAGLPAANPPAPVAIP